MNSRQKYIDWKEMTPRKDSIARQHVNRSHRLTHNRRVRKQFIWQFNLCGNYTLNSDPENAT